MRISSNWSGILSINVIQLFILLFLLSIDNSKPNTEEKVLLSTYCVIDHKSTSGWIRYKNIDYWFQLLNATLSWFTDETNSEKRGSIELKDSEFKCFPNKLQIVLVFLQKWVNYQKPLDYDPDIGFSESNPNDPIEMELTFDSLSSLKQWKKWFENSGIKPFFTKTICETSGETNSSTDKSSETIDEESDEEAEFAEHLKPQVELMKKLVDSHYLIMKKKFKWVINWLMICD